MSFKLPKQTGNFLKASFKLIIGLFSLSILLTLGLVVLFILLVTRKVSNDNTIAMDQLQIDSCEDLPFLSEVNATIIENENLLNQMLENLMTCQNNNTVCQKNGRCIQNDYSKYRISSGNTSVSWKEVAECENKGAVLVRYSSACEGTVVGAFFKKSDELNKLPQNYVNY